MKNLLKKVLGVTLLEVMLVLAIAAMVIVMSVRYYQSATASSQANSAFTQVQTIIAAADSLAQAGGSYSAVVSQAAMSAILTSSGLTMPWGEVVAVASAATNTFTIAFTKIPSSVCPILNARLVANSHLAVTSGSCAGSGVSAITYTYTS